jgi:hypothetical protein
MVSLQQSGAVVKATMPDATGKFTLAPVAPGTYDLVNVAPGRATAVVTDVVVSDETVTTLNTSAAAFAPGPSASATATGTVEPAENGSVRATQALEDGTQIEVAGGPVGGDGVYTLVLPVAAPTVAPWNGGGALAFQDDAGAAGQYTLEATSGTQTDTTGTLTFAAGATVTTPFTFP